MNNATSYKTRTVDQQTAKTIMGSLGGQFVTVTAIKKNGDITKINGKLCGSPPTHAGKPTLITLKRSYGSAYKSVYLTKIIRVAFNKQVIAIVPD